MSDEDQVHDADTPVYEAENEDAAVPSVAKDEEPLSGNAKGKQRQTSPEAEAVKGSTKKRKFVPENGNYRGYYTKRRFNQDPYAGDERLALIPQAWLKDKRVLDIGCNVGKVSIEIAQRFGAYRVTGVDIDQELIRQANREVQVAWSTQEPLKNIQQAAELEREKQRSYGRRSPSRSPSPVDATDALSPKSGHFPAALSRMFGFIPAAPSEKLLRQYVKPTDEESRQRSQRRNGKTSRGSVMPKQVALFPHNLHFKKADWVNTEITSDKRGYDCIFALSVSKWIHINQGDEGLTEFFTRVFMTLLPGGRFILEAQPWQSYAKAARMSTELKEKYAQLKTRPEDFEKILLTDIGFQRVEKFSEDGGEGFKRPLYVYYKAAGSWL